MANSKCLLVAKKCPYHDCRQRAKVQNVVQVEKISYGLQFANDP